MTTAEHDGPRDAPGSTSALPAALAERTEWARSIAGELRRLEPRQAAALLEVYVHRLPCDEAARRLGVTLEEFRTTLSAAMYSLGLRLGHGTA